MAGVGCAGEPSTSVPHRHSTCPQDSSAKIAVLEKNGYRGSSIDCPTCGQAAEFQDYRSKTPLSLLGPVTCTRAYYYSHQCGHGRCPWDEAVGLTPKRLTPAAERVVTPAGTVSNSFAEAAAKVLPELAGLDLSASTAQRTTEAAGQRLGQLLEAGQTLGFPKRWSWHRDAHGRTCAYVSADATGVRQQGPHGSKAEGRMPYVALDNNAVPELPATSPYQPPPGARPQARYLAGLYELPALGLQLRRQAAQVDRDRAALWIGLTDGGHGLAEFLRSNFPRDLVVILDFGHPAEDLAELAKLLHPGDEEQGKALTEPWCHVMKHEGGAGILRVLEALQLPPRKKAVQEQHAAIVGYIRNNLPRMDYPTYLAHGWLIGSGSVGSACKTVVGQRLKLAGMRWGADGTDAVCHLRALFRSEPGQWHAFWRRQIHQPSRNERSQIGRKQVLYQLI